MLRNKTDKGFGIPPAGIRRKLPDRSTPSAKSSSSSSSSSSSVSVGDASVANSSRHPMPKIGNVNKSRRSGRIQRNSVEDVFSSDSSSPDAKATRRSRKELLESEDDFTEVVLLLEEKLRQSEEEVSLLRDLLREKEAKLQAGKRTRKEEEGGCGECDHKDGIISEMYDKIQHLQRALDQKESIRKAGEEKFRKGGGKEAAKEDEVDLDLVLRNIGELNNLLSENARSVDLPPASSPDNSNKVARFKPAPAPVSVAFFRNGFRLDRGGGGGGDGRLRAYAERASRAFLRDLRDGFFPSELQGEYPDGVPLLAADRRGEDGADTASPSSGVWSFSSSPVVAFVGRGRKLRSGGGGGGGGDSGDSGGNATNNAIKRDSKGNGERIRPDSVSLPHLDASVDGRGKKGKANLGRRRPGPIAPHSSAAIAAAPAPPPSGGRLRPLNPPTQAAKRQQPVEDKKSCLVVDQVVISPFAKVNNSDGKDANRKDRCLIKVMGVGGGVGGGNGSSPPPLLLELVAYDTVRTLRGVLANHLRQRGQHRGAAGTALAVEVFAAGGARLDDDSAALGDLGLVPTGVVHVHATRKK